MNYTESEIKEAVNIAVGDDGFKAEQVIEILKHNAESQVKKLKGVRL